MGKVILKGFIVIPDNDLERVTEALPEHIEKTRSERGCLIFNVASDQKNKNRLNVYEEFESREAFDLHQKRVKESNWGQITANAKRCYQIDEIS